MKYSLISIGLVSVLYIQTISAADAVWHTGRLDSSHDCKSGEDSGPIAAWDEDVLQEMNRRRAPEERVARKEYNSMQGPTGVSRVSSCEQEALERARAEGQKTRASAVKARADSGSKKSFYVKAGVVLVSVAAAVLLKKNAQGITKTWASLSAQVLA